MPAMTTRQTRSRPELAVDLLDEEGGVVPRSPGAERAQEGEVLAHLGGIDPGRGGQEFGRHRGGARPEQLLEDPLVDGEPGHRGLGDPAGAGARGRRLGPGDGGGWVLRGTGRIVGPRAAAAENPGSWPRPALRPGPSAPRARRSGRLDPRPRPAARAGAADARSSTRATRPVASSSSPSSPGPSWPNAPTQRPATHRRDRDRHPRDALGRTGPGPDGHPGRAVRGPARSPTRVSGPRSSWALPKRSIQAHRGHHLGPRGGSRTVGCRPRHRSGRTGRGWRRPPGCRSPGSPPTTRWAAAGAKTSRPSKVPDGRAVPGGSGPAPRSSAPRPARRPADRAARCPDPPARSVRPDRHLEGHGPALGPHPRVDHGHHHPGAEVGPGRHQQTRQPAATSKAGTGGKVDDRDGRRQRGGGRRGPRRRTRRRFRSRRGSTPPAGARRTAGTFPGPPGSTTARPTRAAPIGSEPVQRLGRRRANRAGEAVGDRQTRTVARSPLTPKNTSRKTCWVPDGQLHLGGEPGVPGREVVDQVGGDVGRLLALGEGGPVAGQEVALRGRTPTRPPARSGKAATVWRAAWAPLLGPTKTACTRVGRAMGVDHGGQAGRRCRRCWRRPGRCPCSSPSGSRPGQQLGLEGGLGGRGRGGGGRPGGGRRRGGGAPAAGHQCAAQHGHHRGEEPSGPARPSPALRPALTGRAAANARWPRPPPR